MLPSCLSLRESSDQKAGTALKRIVKLLNQEKGGLGYIKYTVKEKYRERGQQSARARDLEQPEQEYSSSAASQKGAMNRRK